MLFIIIILSIFCLGEIIGANDRPFLVSVTFVEDSDFDYSLSYQPGAVVDSNLVITIAERMQRLKTTAEGIKVVDAEDNIRQVTKLVKHPWSTRLMVACLQFNIALLFVDDPFPTHMIIPLCDHQPPKMYFTKIQSTMWPKPADNLHVQKYTEQYLTVNVDGCPPVGPGIQEWNLVEGVKQDGHTTFFCGDMAACFEDMGAPVFGINETTNEATCMYGMVSYSWPCTEPTPIQVLTPFRKFIDENN